MYLPNYWTKLMLLSYLLVWLWSWYFWYFFSTWIWKHEVSSSQIPSMPPLFLLCFLSLLLSFKEISGLCKKQSVWKSVRCGLPNIKRTQLRITVDAGAWTSRLCTMWIPSITDLFVQGKKGNTREVSTPLAKSEISSERSLSQKLVLIIGAGVLFSSIFHTGTKQAGSAAQGRSPDLDCTITGSCSSLLVHWATLLPGGAWICALGSFRKFLIGKSLVMPQHRCTLTLPKVLGANVLNVFLCGVNWW